MLELTALLVLGNGSVSNLDVQKQAYFSILDSVVGEMTAIVFRAAIWLYWRLLNRFCHHQRSMKRSLGLTVSNVSPSAVKPSWSSAAAVRDAGGRIECGSFLYPEETASHSILETVTKEMLQFKDAFPNMYSLYAAALTIEVSTATCEYSFSTVTRIGSYNFDFVLWPTNERPMQLVLLAVEKNLTRHLNLDKFVDGFNTSHGALFRSIIVCRLAVA